MTLMNRFPYLPPGGETTKGALPYTTKLCASHGITVNYFPGELPLEGLHGRFHCQQL